MSSENNNGCIKRIRYFKNQLLTARDFQDQQAYHLDKLRRHVKRFPFGVVNGLDVEFDPESDVFVIESGSAVDSSGREIVVGTDGLKVPRTSFDPAKSYLSIIYSEKDTCDEQSVCDSPRKYNRVCEQAKYQWNSTPDPTGNRITLVQVLESGEDDPYIFRTDFDDEGRRIRFDAKLIDEDNVIFRNVNGHDHSGDGNGTPIPPEGLEANAVIEDKIATNAVTSSKIAPNAVTGDKIKDKAVVRSLNDLTDKVTLVEGKNITIDINSGTKEVTINAAADGHSLDSSDNEGPKDVVSVDPEGVVRIQLEEEDTAQLDVDGIVSVDRFKMATDAGDGKVLTSDSEGNGTWKLIAGDISAITAGTGLTGGGTSGDVTLAIDSLGVGNDQLATGAVTTEKIESTDDSKKIQLANLSNTVRNQLVPSSTHNHTGGSAGPVLNHSDLNLGTATNPHHTTAVDIDTEGGTDQIVEQINAGTGIISKERIEPFVGATGWVRLPFLPRKYSTATEFQHFILHSTSGSGGAQGNMDIPVPPGATRIKRFRIAGTGNEGTVSIQLFQGGTNNTNWNQILSNSITGAPFDENYIIEQDINPESENLGVYVVASGVSDIWFVAAEFE